MKNFEKHIEEIGHDFASGNTPCLLVKLNGGECLNPQKACFECFKEWALTDSEPTPDPLALLKRCKPWLEEKAKGLARLKREYEVGIKLAIGIQIDRFEVQIKSIATELADLDALLSDIEKMEVGE